MTIKCTLLIEVQTNVSDNAAVSGREAGFSESFYWPGSSIATVITRFRGVAMRRAGMLPVGAAVVGQRYQIVNPVGAGQTEAVRYPGATGSAADYPSLGLLCKVPSLTTRNVGHFLLRGLPDARIFEGEYNPNANFRAAFLAFTRALEGFAFEARDLDATQAPLVSIAANGNYVTSANFTPGGATANVRLLRTYDEFGRLHSGAYTANITTATTGTINNWDGVAVTGGKIRLDTTIYPLMATEQIEPVRISSRKVGRPFDLFVGRR